MTFFNITANTVIHDTLTQNATTFNQHMIFNMQFIFTPQVGHAYTFIISPSVQNFSVYPIQEFDLVIEEVLNPTLDSYVFDSNSQSTFAFNNLQSGNTAVSLKNSMANWRINLVGTSLQFQQENPLGSGIWVTKSTLI